LKQAFGIASTGDAVEAVTLTAGELSVTILTWGAIVQDVIGSNDIADYEGDMMHHGSLIGPIVNRISTGRVRIDGMMYELERNQDGRIHLHSGKQATHRRLWTLEEVTGSKAVLSCSMRDGECGLPGNRTITARYEVLVPATLQLTINGTTDAKTMMNFANHSYWNLDGSDSYDGHRLQVHADRYLPGTVDSYPTGEIADVTGTEMDFRMARKISANVPPLDNNFCLSDRVRPVTDALTLTGAKGVSLKVATDQTGIQVFDNRPDYAGLAIEAQSWPDAPNNRDFPSILVTPETPYHQSTRYTFRNGDTS